MMVWTVFLYHPARISLMSTATAAGTSTPSSSLSPEMKNVFQTTLSMSGIFSRYLKFSQPTHCEPKMPFFGENFSNAMTMPTIGT